MGELWLVRLKEGHSCTRDAGGWRVTLDHVVPIYVGHMSTEMSIHHTLEGARRYRGRQTTLVAQALEIVRVRVEVCDD